MLNTEAAWHSYAENAHFGEMGDHAPKVGRVARVDQSTSEDGGEGHDHDVYAGSRSLTLSSDATEGDARRLGGSLRKGDNRHGALDAIAHVGPPSPPLGDDRRDREELRALLARRA